MTLFWTKTAGLSRSKACTEINTGVLPQRLTQLQLFPQAQGVIQKGGPSGIRV